MLFPAVTAVRRHRTDQKTETQQGTLLFAAPAVVARISGTGTLTAPFRYEKSHSVRLSLLTGRSSPLAYPKASLRSAFATPSRLLTSPFRYEGRSLRSRPC
ncbi:hypothetical protein, partial [Haloarcula sp. CBA1122]|uniref:hypothetical protein n=1 Tax=Haloarcula sp. CBA1122 TaxID=2668069 RepID=UPI001309F0D2